MNVRARAALALAAVLLVVAGACGDDSDSDGARAARATTTTAAGGTPTTAQTGSSASTALATPPKLEVTEVATGLETVWALAWDSNGKLWVTERAGRVRQVGGRSLNVAGVVEQGESGLMGLEFDSQDRAYVMFTTQNDNRIARLAADGSIDKVFVEGIRRAAIHDGGRLRFGPDGALYASTGDAGDTSLPQNDSSLNGKVLRIDVAAGTAERFSKGHRNPQGLCFAPDGRFLSVEHGPDKGDEVNVLTKGFNGGWPDQVGNGIKNYTPTIAPGGCEVYDADLIPQWKGSLLFVTLKGSSLHRLTFDAAGKVVDEEVLYEGKYGRLRDVRTGPDGAVYIATSNRDGRGSPSRSDDRVLRIAPA